MQQLLPRTTSSQSCQLTFSNLRAIRCRMGRAVFRGTLGHGDKTTISRDSAKRHFSRLTSYFISGVIIQLLLAIGLAESHYYIALTFGYTHRLPITHNREVYSCKLTQCFIHLAMAELSWRPEFLPQMGNEARTPTCLFGFLLTEALRNVSHQRQNCFLPQEFLHWYKRNLSSVSF